MERRTFLINSFSASALFLLQSCNFKSSPNLLSKNSKFLIGNQIFNKPNSSSLSVTSVHGEQTLIPAPCLGHEITCSPISASLIFATEKSGPVGYIADVFKNSINREITLKNDMAFYGHSLFSSDGKYIFASTLNYSDDTGYISMIDASTLTEVKRISSFGKNPHQLRWVEKDKVIAVANAFSTDSSLDYSMLNLINIKSGELIKSFRTNTRSRHFTISSDGETAFIGRNTATIDAKKTAEEIKRYRLFNVLKLNTSELIPSPDRLSLAAKAECLSHILVENLSLVIMTIVGLNEVVVWNYQNNREEFSFKVTDSPQGITLSEDKKTIHISFQRNDQSSYINFYDLNSFLKQNFTAYSIINSGNGSHLTLLSSTS